MLEEERKSTLVTLAIPAILAACANDATRSLEPSLPKAFASVQPDLGTIGTMGARSIAGPAFWGLDLSLSRSFQLRESQRLEFRAEAYNFTNSLRPGNPTTALNSSQFGQITTALDPRLLQFAMKFVF